MLYLNPPYHMIDGVTILPDHADQLQRYYMPMSPHVTTYFDEATGQTVPKIQVIKFAGTSAASGERLTGGFLDFDCNIGVPPQRLEAIAEELRSRENLPDLPRLQPVPVIDGSVKMMLFGAETPGDDSGLPGRSADDGLDEDFVVDIVHNAKPSLYGDNQAAFSVRLGQAGVTAIEQALQGELAPIGIVYSLQYVGLRPAYDIKVEANWERVQTHIEESETVNVPFIASSSIEEVIDELIELGHITIESDLFVADGDDTGGAAGRHEAAMAQVRDLVFENFFEPSLEPMDRESGDTIDNFGRFMRTVATHGFTSVWGRKEVDLTRIDRKKLNIDLSERTSVIREIHPQGHLVGLSRIIEQQGLDLDRFVRPVSLDDPFFAERKIRVIPRADFATDQIRSINVSLEYDGVVKNVPLDAASAESTVTWPSSLDDGRMRSGVNLSYETTFDTSATGRPRSLRSQSEVVDGELVEISPRSDVPYELRWISFNVVDFPWHLYHTAEIHCEYIDPDNGIDIRNHYGLTHQHHTGAWPVFTMDQTKRTVRYRLTFHGYDGRDWAGEWTETDEDQIRITDPFSQRRTLDIVVPSSLFATQLDRVFVDVSYRDPDNGIEKRESFELSAQDSATKRFVVELVDPARRLVDVKVSMITIGGEVIDVPESTTGRDRIIVTPNMRGHRTIDIGTDGGLFGPAELASIRVETRYDRPDAGLRFSGDVSLASSDDNATFEYDFAVGDETYEYRITHHLTNGLSRDSGWQRSSADRIVATTTR